MQRRPVGPSAGNHQEGGGDEETRLLAAVALRRQQDQHRIELQQQLLSQHVKLQQLAAVAPAAGSATGSLLAQQQHQQDAATLALASDLRAAALEAQFRQQLAQVQHQLMQHPDHLLLARALAEQQHHQQDLIGAAASGGRHLLSTDRQRMFQQQQQFQRQQHHHNQKEGLGELEIRLLQERQLQQQQKPILTGLQSEVQKSSTEKELIMKKFKQNSHSNNHADLKDTLNGQLGKSLDRDPQMQLRSLRDDHTSPSESSVAQMVGAKTEVRNLMSSAITDIEERDFPKNTDSESAVTKDKLDITPGSILVPCRARGMPMDHNFKTAYFVIPSNIRHGEDLKCSYPACQNSGNKFRYCTHCRIPVAKRNFRKRHNHGMSTCDIVDSDDDDDDRVIGQEDSDGENQSLSSVLPSSVSKNIKSDVESISNVNEHAEKNQHKPKVPTSQVVAEEKEGDVQSNGCSSPISSQIVHKIDDSSEAQSDRCPVSTTPTEDVSSKLNGELGDNKRARLWLNLLWERPSTQDSNSMSAWLLKVLSVSDLDKPLHEEVNETASKSQDAEDLSEQGEGKQRFHASSKPVKKRNKEIYDENKTSNSTVKSRIEGYNPRKKSKKS